MVIFPHFFARAKKRSQRNHTKGETGVMRRTKAKLLSLLINPFPFGIPLTPMGQDLLAHPIMILRAGQNCFAGLIGDVGRNRNRVLFCFEETENGATKGLTILQDIPLSE